MRPIFILLGLPAFASPAAAAQEAAPTPTLSIAAGETVTVRIADNERGFILLSRTRGEAGGARAENTVRFSFSNMGGQMMLRTENGYARAFNYRARMFSGRRSANTSICTVLPNIIGFESWGDRIDRLELREPRLSDSAEMRCQ
ncbi:MAG: hypothetical protein QOD42_2912 [Sphingomonadales bacterium]|jgi:hypothetical protein|nr:hypothetical protein [Sphingomonadales bacterium]